MEIITKVAKGEIRKAASALKNGHLVAFPTETVYGLGADANNEKAINRIYSVKGRPADHPLIVHISSFHQIDKWAIDIPAYAVDLARHFWPGPMTLILNRSELAKDFVTGRQNSIGLRVPNHQMARALLEEFESNGGLGVAAPSANKFGAVSPTSAMAVVQELGSLLSEFDLILDDGQSEVGIESTIIECTSKIPKILRPGAISKELVQEITGLETTYEFISGKIKAPGHFRVHYSPAAKVILDKKPLVGDGFYALAEFETPKGAIRLGAPTNIKQFAQNLYAALRLADQKELKQVSVFQPIGEGLALAVRERLSKASAR